jgi:hypothetical protein
VAKADINDIIDRNIDAFILYKENVPFLKGGAAASYVVQTPLGLNLNSPKIGFSNNNIKGSEKLYKGLTLDQVEEK